MAGVVGISPVDTSIRPVQQLSAAESEGNARTDFGSILREQLDQVVHLNNNAEQLQQQFAAGKISDINEVVLAVTKAELALSLALELRNKVVEAYQELSRTQL